MTRHASFAGQVPPENGYQVHTPRTCDAIGSALRQAYDRDIDLPDDMALILHRMGPPPATTRDR